MRSLMAEVEIGPALPAELDGTIERGSKAVERGVEADSLAVGEIEGRDDQRPTLAHRVCGDGRERYRQQTALRHAGREAQALAEVLVVELEDGAGIELQAEGHQNGALGLSILWRAQLDCEGSFA